MKKAYLAIPLLVAVAACATTPGGAGRRSARVLTMEEIEAAGVVTAADAIELLRPQWLHTRASPTMGSPDGAPPTLYVDGMRVENFREIERIRASVVQRMEFLSPSDATNRFGTDHVGGAILITTR